MKTLPVAEQAFRAINTFKDEYLLDYINVEELDVRDRADIDEKVIENSIVHNIKNFILTFGKDFAFIRNQYHLDAFGEDQYIDLLFFNRQLNCLVAVELKKGKFKTSYLGQLQGYLSVLDGFERKPHENPSIGLILCKDMNRSFVDYVIQDYSKPMGVATYKTSKDMSEELKNALPDVEAIFQQENISRHSDYYLQTMLYACLIQQSVHYNANQLPVSPALLFIQHTADDPILRFGKDPIYHVADHLDTFGQLLKEKVEEIFNPDLPFTPTPDITRCATCPDHQFLYII